jgi:hypothetical protein
MRLVVLAARKPKRSQTRSHGLLCQDAGLVGERGCALTRCSLTSIQASVSVWSTPAAGRTSVIFRTGRPRLIWRKTVLWQASSSLINWEEIGRSSSG